MARGRGGARSASPVDVPRLVEEAEFKASWHGTADTFSKAVADGALFVVRRDGHTLYPSFFCDLTLDPRQLAVVSKLLTRVCGHARWLFFVSPKGSLAGMTPLEALRRGMFTQVKATAQGYAER